MGHGDIETASVHNNLEDEVEVGVVEEELECRQRELNGQGCKLM